MTERIDKDSLPLNKPRRTPNHPTKSHIVKTMVDGKEKIIRFGEQGAETAGKPKAGESERMKQKRASFKSRHAENIAKGPRSAAYWADKVKWADGGSVETKGNRMAEARSISQNAALSKLADLLSKAKDIGNKIDLPVIGGLGDLVVGETPSEVENWSYGNYPIQATEMGLPQIKRERKQSLADAVMTLAPIAKLTEDLPVGLSIKAYHGSPHQFDRFDMSKIGTGEGAQAYGHGLYFAQNPEVSEQYRKALSSLHKNKDIEFFDSKGNLLPEIKFGQPMFNARQSLGANEGNFDEAIKQAEDEIAQAGDSTSSFVQAYIDSQKQKIKDINELRKLGVTVKKPTGAIYETSIQWPDAAREAADPLSEHHLLDWDKPLSEQSDYVKQSLLNSEYEYGPLLGGGKIFNTESPVKAGNAYDDLVRKIRPSGTVTQIVGTGSGNSKGQFQDAVSQHLNSLGIPGIKYLDKGSRATGGSSNYVMFGDEYPQIVNRAGSLDELQQRYAGGGSVIKAVKSLAKNLNKDLIEKYLSTGKLSPEEMAKYEKNALAMETPNLQRFNVENAEAQIPDIGKRARSMGFITQPSKEQYHLSASNWYSNTPDLTRSDLGFHTGTLEQAESRGRAKSPPEYEFDIGQHIIPIVPNKYTNMMRLKDTGSFHADAIAPQLEKKGILAKGMGKKIQDAAKVSYEMNEFYDPKVREWLKQNNIDAIKYANEQEGIGDSYAYINPSLIRSRFAAFDPLREASPSLLAGTALGDLLLKYASPEQNKEKPENYAQGGAVDFDKDKINAIIDEFHQSEYGLRPEGTEKGRDYLNEVSILSMPESGKIPTRI